MALHSALTRLREGGTLGNKLENDSLTPKLVSAMYLLSVLLLERLLHTCSSLQGTR